VEQEPEIKGLDLDDVFQDLDAIRDVVNALQPSPLTLADFEAILRQPELLPPGCSARPIGAYDFAWSQPGLEKELRVTCNASYYEENSDSCELWVHGSPLFPMEEIIEVMGHSQSQADRSQLEAALGTITAPSQHR
jgi:hypothetical protein